MLVVLRVDLVELAEVVGVQWRQVLEVDGTTGLAAFAPRRGRGVLAQCLELLLRGPLDDALPLPLPLALSMLSQEPLYLLFRGLQSKKLIPPLRMIMKKLIT